VSVRDVVFLALGWGAATVFWFIMWLATEWSDIDWLEDIFL
jgi:hypothetical protein